MCEDTKGPTTNRKSKKDRQCNGQKKTKKKTNNILQNTTQQTKYWATRTQQYNLGWTQVLRIEIISYCTN